MDVTIIGAGNVATHFFKIFDKRRITVSAIWSRNIENANAISPSLATDSLDFSDSKSNIFIIAIKDDAILSILDNIILPDNITVVHTSGSVEMDIFKAKSDNYGIIYPLQTFSKIREIDFFEIPILVEASNEKTLIELKTLAQLISQNVQKCNSEQRRQIHLAAVFASNFTNKLLGVSKDILAEKDLDFNLLKPLVQEQINKAFELTPEKAQTGPAIRGDEKTIAKHLEMLDDDSENQELYELISGMIGPK